MRKGQDLWIKAKKIIPGGSQLLSKRSELFLPKNWPSYYQKAKGVEIWDLDNNKYIDMSIMGVGACILGYADEDVDESVINAIKNGSMSTLNCYEEVELAELLLKIDSWAGMVRYSRSGGEAMTMAVRIGRAYSKKDKIAFCGYHGWHDWYLAANLANEESLDGHLLPGLQPAGVPRNLKGTAIPFEYNQIDQLREIVKANDIGVIVLETIRNFEPQNSFLQLAREIADEIGAVLIFDEITSGWRLDIGGAFKKYGVTPDIVVYGKAMANGYPMAVLVGRSEIMDIAQTSFISSTFWTERIGPTASIATIEKMKTHSVQKHLCKIGEQIVDGWNKLAQEHEIKLTTSGIPPLGHFAFNHDDQSLPLRTLFTQEMLKKGYLASSSVYVSYKHTNEIINSYLEDTNDVFAFLKQAIEKDKISDLLEGPVAHSGFRRLT
ncbi:MAG: aminotransferase class III-fold pyridoxal phosphate-dependent enzyme [Candidatus Hodarchaeales archaeon]|jgi:glutamate-1-semialdehyde aminotransferase